MMFLFSPFSRGVGATIFYGFALIILGVFFGLAIIFNKWLKFWKDEPSMLHALMLIVFGVVVIFIELATY